jgi:glucan phosphoethanolaminetransferase (alkaline phosphatase superfamily)
MKFLQFIFRLICCEPVLRTIAEKLNGHKTKMGAVGSCLLVIVYFIYALFPDMVDPAVVDPETIHTSLQAAIASFLALAFGGMGHKVVKKQREKETAEQQLDELKKKIQDYENTR